MRHFLKFLPAAKRAEAERQYAVGNNAGASTSQGMPERARPAPSSHATHSAKPLQAASAAQRTPAAKPKGSTRLSHPGAPQTHRAGGHAGDYDDVHRPRTRPAPQPEKPQPNVASDVVGIKARLEAAAATESTGAFLSSLDNSAIALADSGLFNADIEDAADGDESPDAGFNPYNRG